MERTIRTVRRSVLAAAFGGALAFGAGQALATPPPAAAAPSCDELCNRACRAAGFIGGFCGSGLSCNCYL